MEAKQTVVLNPSLVPRRLFGWIIMYAALVKVAQVYTTTEWYIIWTNTATEPNFPFHNSYL